MGGEDDGGEGVNGGFQYVARKVKSNRKRRKGRKDTSEEGMEGKLSKRKEIIATKKTLLITGEIGKMMESLLERVLPAKEFNLPQYILALGLGSVKTSKAAQLQLAFLLLVREKLEKNGSDQRVVRVEAYDPIFDDEDRDLLTSLKITPLQFNVQGRYPFEETVFVYMPHCTRTLYENLLRSNWSSTGLSRLYLCCNNLERYADLKSSNQLTPCIKRIGQSSVHIPYPDQLHSHSHSFSHSVPRLVVDHLPLLPSPNNDALNDLAIQRYNDLDDSITLLTEKLSQTTFDSQKEVNKFWILPPEAKASIEEDPELI